MEISLHRNNAVLIMIILSFFLLSACNKKNPENFATISTVIQGNSTQKNSNNRFDKHELPVGMTKIDFIITDSDGAIVEASVPVSPVAENINIRVAAHKDLTVTVKVFAGNILSFEGETQVNALQPGQTFSVDIELNPIAGTINTPIINGAFVTTWKTDVTGNTAATQIKIGTHPDFVYNFNINWGDGTTNEGVPGDIIHTYNTAGTYTVQIEGDFPQPYFGETNTAANYDAAKLISIEQWGNIKWQSMNLAFLGCINMSGNAIDSPDLTLVTNMIGMFQNAAVFNQNINSWDVSSITDMHFMFNSAFAFNQSLSNWNVSSVTDMGGMFNNASTFNQDIANWNVSSVTFMDRMFNNAVAFNQDINIWNVSNVSNMRDMFNGATTFNQNIGNWDVSSVADMDSMFNNVTLSVANYDALLISWSALNLQSNISFSGGNSTYSLEAESARNAIIQQFFWEINDAGVAP